MSLFPLITRRLHQSSRLCTADSYFKFLNHTTSKLQFLSKPNTIIPMFQLLGVDGKLHGDDLAYLDLKEKLPLYLRILKQAIRINVFDKILYESQRQGRISFYMQSSGEEISIISSCSALDPKDLIFSQYREVGALLWRGFTEQLMVHQLFGTKLDLTKGRQMPMHFSSPEHCFVSVSSPLATQIPQAVGAAYSYKLMNSNNIVACYFGDGAASEGDFHAAMNMASVLKCPVMFLCRNNQYAISTSVDEQYNGDGIALHAQGYGIDSIRVDGNDAIAVNEAVTEARKYCLKNSMPFIVELITYRVGHHSTSDDSSAYRDQQQTKEIDSKYNGIHRLSTLLKEHGIWSEELEKDIRNETRAKIVELIKEAENTHFHSVDEAFNDVYDEMQTRLKNQKKMFMHFYNEYPQNFDSFEKK